GGRVLTHRDARVPVPIELGAEFVHGEAAETTRLLREAGQTLLDLGGEAWERRSGRLHPAKEYWPLVDRVLSRIPLGGPDLSLEGWLAKRPGGPTLARGRTLARRFVQGFHAADPARVSLRSLAAGGKSPTATARNTGRVAGGYDRVIQWLARHLEREAHSPASLRLRSPVAEISWSPESAELEIRPEKAAPYRLSARAAVVTAPLGVLQVPAGEPGSLRFRPELPPRARRALGLLAMGTAVHVAFWFRQAPWEEKLANLPAGRNLSRLRFLHTTDSAINVWWTAYPARLPLAVAWSGGPPAAALLAQGTGALVDHALGTLAETLGLPRRRLQSQAEAFWTHDWLADPWSRGAYSYALVGGVDAARDLAKPIASTLFLAGEAMDAEGRNGTVEGAIASGLRAAGQVKRALARADR
ncbi:MAG TPA: NAD(P)/FAD-dependent oxidoreductase, partial [Thermoanaerobaculia bacterium]|nr:NAD(P)/FAD-dependent oxidoreductase [Thermoanaerobaculia bacterium]